MAIPSNGLICRLTGDNVTGSTLNDEQGNYNFAMYGSPVIGPGLIGDSVFLDGQDDELRYAGNNILTGSFTITALIQLAPGESFFFMQGRDGYGSGWNINCACHETGIAVAVVTGSPIATRSCSYTFPQSVVNRPLFVAFRYSAGGQVDVSFDEFRSVAASSFSGTGLRSSTYGSYFGRAHSGSPYYKSILDEALFYNRYLSDSELDDILLTMSGYEVAGTITQDGSPLSTEIRIYKAATGDLLHKTTSDANGDYSQVIISPDPVYVMSVPPAGYRPLVHGPVDPTLKSV